MARRLRWTVYAAGAIALALGIFVIFVVFVIHGFDFDPNSVTSYPATCAAEIVEGRCPTPGWTLDPATVRVSVAEQQVVTLEPGRASHPLAHCAVISSREWRCTSMDGALSMGFRRGVPWMAPPSGQKPTIFFLPRWRYLWMRIGEPHAASAAGRALFR